MISKASQILSWIYNRYGGIPLKEPIMVSYEKALETILASVNRLEKTRVSLDECAGYVLAEDVPAAFDLPPFDNSAMDGYAVVGRSVEKAGMDNPTVLTYLGDVDAGGGDRIEVREGEAARIGTGAKVPRGADTVVMVEDTEFREGKVYIFREYATGSHIRMAGEDFVKGREGLRAGTRIRPAEACFLAANAVTDVPVYRRPKVGVLPTGGEILPPGEPVSGTKIHDANGPTLVSLVRKYGGEAHYLGIGPDDEEKLIDLIGQNAPNHDALITCGGISKGHHDHVKDALGKAGTRIEFWTTAIRPGKPFGFGKLGDTLIFALPGNPVSSFVTFEIYCQPALTKAMGCTPPYREFFQAKLLEDFPKKPGFTFLVRGNLEGDYPDYAFRPSKKQGSGMISSLVKNSVIMIAPAERDLIGAGESVEVFRI
jgi:molybdopterin molybdotransferase